MPDEKVVYKEGITNFLEAFRPRLGPRIRERLRSEAGVDESTLKPRYPLASHDAVVKILAEELHPGTPYDSATYDVGRALLNHYGRSVLGRAIFSIIRLVGPMRMLKRTPDYYKLTNNYADVKLEVLTEKSYVVDHNEVGAVPHFMRGTLQGSGEVIGLPGHAVELIDYDGHRGRYKVSWS